MSFDPLVESGARRPISSPGGVGVALVLHAVVLSLAVRQPRPIEAAASVVVESLPVVAPAPADRRVQPPAPPHILIDGAGLTIPPIVVPHVPESVLQPVPLGGAGPSGATPNTASSVSGNDPSPIAVLEDSPELLSAQTPRYPDLLRRAGVEGRVIVGLVVDTLGRAEPGSLRIVRSDNAGFDRSALAALRDARFRPARVYGRAVRVVVEVPVMFRLDRSGVAP